MTPTQHARAKEIFLAACGQPADQRAAFLDEACGSDAALHEHVIQLLRYHSDDQANSERPVQAATTAAAHAGATRPAGSASGCRFETGALVLDRYRIVRLVGRGGMGEVYQADDLVLGQTVALKFLPELLRKMPGCIERIGLEVRAARAVTNAHVCRIHDIHIDPTAGELFMSMEFVDGEDLDTLIRRIGRFSPDKGTELARQICIGLAAAHARGILHRDLKPGNIMIDGQGRARVADFGLAAPVEQVAANDAFAGTPRYMAPELLAGSRVSVQSDIYALGLVLYELFTGRPAFQADSLSEYARLHQRARPTPAVELVPDLPAEINRVILHCLQKDPGDRPSSALAVAAELPGGNPLFVALAAGVTPSPAVVAAAGTRARLNTRTATVCLVAALAGLLIVGLLAGRSGVVPDLRNCKPASVLVDRARQLAQELTRSAAPAYEASGFTFRPEHEFFRAVHTGFGRKVEFAAHAPAGPAFWYRTSIDALSPISPLNITLGYARATLNDPPRHESGMTTLVLDQRGQLLGFERVPDYPRGPPDPRVDWSAFFAAAGLDPSDYVLGHARLNPGLACDQQYAWIRRTRADSTTPARVEAATFQSRPVHFAVLRNARATADSPTNLDSEWRTAVVSTARFGLIALAAVGALPLAWLNIRRGRGDRAGAVRVGGMVFGGRLLIWALGASHGLPIVAELRLLLSALLGAWLEASLVWLFYIALEPYIRRFWPQTIVTWSQLLTGRVRDPRVGRDVLAGVLLGTVVVLLIELDRITLGFTGWTVREPLYLFYELNPLLSTRHGLAACVDLLLATIYLAFSTVMVLVLMRVLLRRTWLAGLATTAVAVPMYLPGMANPAVSWLPLLIVVALLVWAAARHGLVVVLCAILVTRLLLQLPVSFSAGEPGWDMGQFVLLVISGLSICGFALARARLAPIR